MLNTFSLLKITLGIKQPFLLLQLLVQGLNKLTEEQRENFYSATFFFLIKLKVSWLFLLPILTAQIWAMPLPPPAGSLGHEGPDLLPLLLNLKGKISR